MRQGWKSVRFERGALAVAVLVAHLVLVYLIIQSRIHLSDLPEPEPVMATLMDDVPQARAAFQPVQVQTQRVIPNSGILAKVPDVRTDEPDVPQPLAPDTLQTIPPPAFAPPAAPRATYSSSDGESGNSSALGILQRTLPRYPAASVRAGEEGSSILQLHVDERGRVIEVRLARSSGFSRLDDAALQAVRKWKFAPAVKGAKAVSAWGEMELRFNLYRFTYSRIGERPADRVPGEQVKVGATEVATPGGEAALRRFIDDLKSANVPGAQGGSARDEIAKIRSALDEWGAVKAVQFSGGVGDHGWTTYDIKPEFRDSQGRGTVEVRWDMYEVRHEHGTSEWRVAVDRDGTVWCAQAGAAPSSR